jgi:hypothetical protein
MPILFLLLPSARIWAKKNKKHKATQKLSLFNIIIIIIIIIFYYYGYYEFGGPLVKSSEGRRLEFDSCQGGETHDTIVK